MATPVTASALEPPPPATAWDLNLRAILRLWPEPSPNVAALAAFDGQPYDEETILAAFPASAANPRAVRQTFEALAQSALMYRDRSVGDQLRISPLGGNVLSFLGIVGERRFANAANLELVARPLIRALAAIVECRAIWMLMRACSDMLSNEELNRAIARIPTLAEVPAAAAAINKARLSGDPTEIGPREYEEAKYGGVNETDQRKAMNPQFLLAGGGGVFISLGHGNPMRRLEPWSIPWIDRALATEDGDGHADLERAAVLRRSRAAGVPPDHRT